MRFLVWTFVLGLTFIGGFTETEAQAALRRNTKGRLVLFHGCRTCETKSIKNNQIQAPQKTPVQKVVIESEAPALPSR